MPHAPEVLLLAALVVAVAYTAFGLTGFGSTVIALPLLMLLIEVAEHKLLLVSAAAVVKAVYALLVLAGLLLLARSLPFL